MRKALFYAYDWGQGRTQFIHLQVGSISHPAKYEQPITHKHVLLWRTSLIGGTAVTIILCLHAGPTRGGCSRYIGPGPWEPRSSRESLKSPIALAIDVYFVVFIWGGGGYFQRRTQPISKLLNDLLITSALNSTCLVQSVLNPTCLLQVSDFSTHLYLCSGPL
jgi:hypothetical protein